MIRLVWAVLAALMLVALPAAALPEMAIASTPGAAMGAIPAAGQGLPLTVLVLALNLRAGPGTHYPVLGVLRLGEILTATGRTSAADWYQVTADGGRTGWVSGDPDLVRLAGESAELPVAAGSPPGATLPGSGSAINASAQGGSPGQSTIVFQTSSGAAIYAINVDGTGLRYLTSGIDPSLSPDGAHVAFTRWSTPQPGARGSLWVIGLDGSDERLVSDSLVQPKSPGWSPDGRQIVLSVQNGGSLSPGQACFETGGSRRCISTPADPWWGISIVDLETGAVRVQPSSPHSFAPVWDPALPWRVVFHGDRGLTNLDVVQGTIWALTTDTSGRTPAFSPDGRQIAVTYRQSGHWEVHVMKADGSGDHRLTFTPADLLLQARPVWNNAAPAWSPDGTQIAFLTDRTGQWEIWVMNADGSNQHPLFPSSLYDQVQITYAGVDERMLSWR